MKLRAQDVFSMPLDTLIKPYEEFLPPTLSRMPLKSMDSVFKNLYDVSGGKSISTFFVRENLDVHLDKYEKIGRYRVLNRFDSTGKLLVKKYTKPWYVSKNRGRLFPFQMLPINQTFWFLHQWEEDKPDKPTNIGGYTGPAPQRTPFPMNQLLLHDSASHYYFLFDDFSRKRDSCCNCVIKVFYMDSYYPLNSYADVDRRYQIARSVAQSDGKRRGFGCRKVEILWSPIHTRVHRRQPVDGV